MQKKKRILLKIGSNTLTKETDNISRGKIEDIASQIAKLKETYEFIIVSSSQINQIEMFEIDQRDWANVLELELDRSGFLYSYIELDEKVHTGLSTVIGKYTIELKNHPGHKIIMRLLFRGGIGNSSLTGFYENHIKTGQELIEILNKEITY